VSETSTGINGTGSAAAGIAAYRTGSGVCIAAGESG
jgi:hypothetical protein